MPMLLVTGATGFIGSYLIRYLIQRGIAVRALITPSSKSPLLPRNLPVEIAVSSLQDERGIRAALKGISGIYHLASSGRDVLYSKYEQRENNAVENLLDASKRVGIEKIVYLSVIGADKTSGFPFFRTCANSENRIQDSGINYTILRTSVVFGPGDDFIFYFLTGLSKSIGFFFLPGREDILLQPLWINDLTHALFLSYSEKKYVNQSITIGGGEYLTLNTTLKMIMKLTKKYRLLIPIMPAILRARNLWFGESHRGNPISTFWIDFLAADRTCSLNTLPYHFEILPSRFEEKLNEILFSFQDNH
jgi:NADH dehydrogenase